MTTARPFTRGDLAQLNAFVSAEAARVPQHVYLTTSDVAWRLPGSGPKQNLQLWHDDLGFAGFVWFEPTTGFEFEIRDGIDYASPLASEMFEWAEARRREFAPAYPRFVDLDSMQQWTDEILHPRPPGESDELCVTTVAFDSDAPRVEFLEARGYRATKHFVPDYRRDLTVPIPEARLPAGIRLRHVTEADLDARVVCHRAAWLKSAFDADRYAEIRRSPCYDAELDIVLDVGDGTFASYCICWADRTTGVGSFEPVGTRPEWRGRGIGREVIYEGLRRLSAKGMRYARVGTAGFNTPAQALYESCGFERIGTLRTFMKVLDR
jgi:ribosomal protein S18 acetylase RimI-like enzyme